MKVVTAVIAISFGVLVLIGYFFPVVGWLQTILLNWAIILAGVAMLVGVGNLISVHAGKVRRGQKGGIYSALLVVSLLASGGLGIVLRPEHAVMKVVMNGIIIPSEATLLAILTISLLYAAIRLLRRRTDLMSILFLLTSVVVLLGTATLPQPFGDVPVVGTAARWITQVLALGGMRGLLIGISLGALTTGLRILFGADRPYGGN
jgi:hypothetical protein